MTHFTPLRVVQVALAASFGAALFLFTPACAPECVDQFDCAAKAKPGEILTCVNGSCVAGSPSGDAGMGGGAGGGSGGGTGGGMGGGTGGGSGDAGMGGGTGGGSGDAGTGGGTGGGGNDAGTGGGTGGGGGGGGGTIAGTYVATLTNEQEVPPVTQGTSGTGTFTVTQLADGGYNVAWMVTHDIPMGVLSGGHIHTGIGGRNGGVTVTFSGSLASPISGNADITPAQAQDLAAGRMYVNIHTSRNTGGEIRGQILRPGEHLNFVSLAPVTRPDGGTVGGVNAGAQFILTNPDGGRMYTPGVSFIRYEGGWDIAATRAALRFSTEDGGFGEIVVLSLTDGGMGAAGTVVPTAIVTSRPYLVVEDADGPALQGSVFP